MNNKTKKERKKLNGTEPGSCKEDNGDGAENLKGMKESGFECRECHDWVMSTEPKRVWYGCTRKNRQRTLSEKPSSVFNEMTKNAGRHLPTFTSCCFFSFATVSKSTAGSGFYNDKQQCVKCLETKKTKVSKQRNWGFLLWIMSNWINYFLINTYKLVDRGMQPSSVDSLHGGNSFKTSSCTEAVTNHRL